MKAQPESLQAFFLLHPSRVADLAFQSLSTSILRAIEAAVPCRDIEASEAGIAKRAAHRHVCRRGMRLENGARRRNHVEHRPASGFLPAGAGNNVAVTVQAH